jgi:hypothetical protein
VSKLIAMVTLAALIAAGSPVQAQPRNGPDEMIFYKPTMTRQTYNADHYQCEMEARRVANTFGKNDPAERSVVMCMLARGYDYIWSGKITDAQLEHLRKRWRN